MSMNSNRFRYALLGASAMVSAAAVASASSAADARAYDFDMPAQPLTLALKTFGATADQQLIFSEALVKDRVAPPLKGAYTPDQALAMLLNGTGLVADKTPGGVVTIRNAADPQAGSAADGAEGTVQALIVTAQKREEDIQDVPIAISAFTQEDLTRSQIAGGPDLITQVPNMTFTKTNFSSYSIQLRGIGTQAISATVDPAVAVAFNNTPFIQNRFFEQEFYDLQRIEVLRGPQGTLYGRNATAGVVNIISAKPKFNYEAKLSGDVGNYNSTRLEGMINIPLVEDMVAVRFAGAWTKRDGYATNQISGNPIDGRDLWSTRASLRVSPSSAIDMNLIWEHFQEDDDRLRSGKQLCKKDVVTEVGGVQTTSFNQPLRTGNISAPWVNVQARFSQGCERESLYSPDSFQTPNGTSVPYYLPLAGVGLQPRFFDPYASQVQSQDLRVIESTVDPDYRAKADLGELQISWNVTNNLTLASETAYDADFVYSLQDFNRFNTVHGAFCTTFFFGGSGCSTGTGGPSDMIATGIIDENGVFCDPQIGCSDRLVAIDIATQRARQFSQELRLSSDFDGPFNFSLGANFLRFDTEAKYYVFINTLTMAAANGGAYSALLPYVPGVSDNRECMTNGLLPGDPNQSYGYNCIYIEQNSIANIQDQGHNYFLSKNPYKLISYAVFGEAYYNVTDTLKVTAGLRWTVDKKEAPRIPSWAFVGDTRGYPVMEVIDQEWREPTGRLAIDWKPDLSFTDETLLYASYAHGYKAGGANPPPLVYSVGESAFGETDNRFASATRPKTFEPEFVDAFELGAKNTFADGRATLNLAAFYYDYAGYQISEIVDRSAFNQNYDATVWGLEIEADWRPLENLKLGFKGGYESARIKDGEQAIDLMDRTAGNPDWVVVRPFPTSPSSCILPAALFSHTGNLSGVVLSPGYTQIDDLGGGGGSSSGGCEYAYLLGRDPVTNQPYVAPYPTDSGSNGDLFFWPTGEGTPNAYPGWDPSTAPNHGEGFYKDLGGNPLPNAPEFTGTITVDYTLPLANDWLMTLHTDLYAQSNAYWRIFDDHTYDKLHPYFTMNAAAIFTNEDAGWKVMAYVKNVFNRDAITGAFLNSDDTGLTTNVFLTEPRLYGLRVTKEWSGGSPLGTFGHRHDGPYPFTVEVGGQVQRHDAPNEALAPSFIDQFPNIIDPLADQQTDLDWGDGREVKLTWQPNNGWKTSVGVRFGKTNGSTPWATRSEVTEKFCPVFLFSCQSPPGSYYYAPYNYRSAYTISSTTDREEHVLVDFAIGKDIGIGDLDRSTLTAAIRYADIESTTGVRIFGITHWDFPETTKYGGPFNHDRYDATIAAHREFKGAGPVLSWDASTALLGNTRLGVLGVDWSAEAGVLFGRRKTAVTGAEVAEYVSQNVLSDPNVPTTTTSTAIDFHRSESVTVPTFGATLGLSYRLDRFNIGAGYRWERYQGAIDGGYSQSKGEDRTIDGPYFKVSVGFGG